MRIQHATLSHLPAVVDIYNEAIRKKFATADRKEFSAEDKMTWFLKHDEAHPLYVAMEDESVIGWYSLSAYREGRQALAGVRELSYYVRSTHQQKGIGSALMKHAISTAKGLGTDHLLAILLEKNIASIALLEKFGFEKWGHLPMVADFDGERCGHLYYGLDLR